MNDSDSPIQLKDDMVVAVGQDALHIEEVSESDGLLTKWNGQSVLNQSNDSLHLDGIIGVEGEDNPLWLQTTQPTNGGVVTADSSCCANCVEPPRPPQWGPDLPFFGHAGHADPLDGWCCWPQKRMMSRPIQVRQL